MIKRLLPRTDAADYLGMSVQSFDKMAAPSIPWIPFGSRKLYDVHDLDMWVERQPKMHPCLATLADSPNAEISGGSTSAGESTDARSRFENRLAAGNSTTRLRTGIGESLKSPQAIKARSRKG